jgi:D-alanine-D-alanine ligase
VRDALADRGHDTQLLILDPEDLGAGGQALCEQRPDVVFQLVEEVGGRPALNYLGALLLETLGIPYTGNPVDVMVTTTDKPATKAILRAAGLPTPAWVPEPPRLNGEGGRSLDDVTPDDEPDGPYIVKPARGDGSVGIDESNLRLAPDRNSARSLLAGLPASPAGWFAERYVHGREFNLSLLGVDGEPTVLPVAEIEFPGYPADRLRIVGYRAKWDPESFEWQHTARRFDFPPADRDLSERLEELARECWDCFRLRGYARVDFRVDAEGRPWILEINCNPGIAPDAGFVAAGARAGMDYGELMERILIAAVP